MMYFISNLKPGIDLNNNELSELFLCSTQGGMRRSYKTNTLVIIVNHIASLRKKAAWVDGVLYYTGMGTKGDQRFDFAQNKTLFESRNNGVDVHLFEVFSKNEYIYAGQVELNADPFFEKQPDVNGNLRNVCVFPLILKPTNF